MSKTIKYIIVFGLTLIILFVQSQTVWQMKNPKIPYSGCDEVFFINETKGWILGDDQELIRTTDGGETWEMIYLFTSGTISQIYFVNDLLGFAAGNYVYRTDDGGHSWEKVFFYPSYDSRALFFVNANTGWFANYNGKIYSTNDGGTIWILQDHPANDSDLRKIFFINDQFGWAIFRNGSFIKTENGGDTWELLHDDLPSGYYKDLCFLNETEGWITVGRTYNLHTANGGYSFDTVFIETDESLYGTKFFDEYNGIAYSRYEYFKTTDGGANWVSSSFPVSSPINTTSLPTLNYMCIANGDIHYTSDGGSTWESPDAGFTENLYGVFCTGEGKLFVVGDNGCIKISDDSGDTWINQTSGTDEILNDIVFTDEENGWVCGDDGTLYYTADGGDNWIFKNLNLSEDLLSLFFVDEQTGFISGNNGVLFKTVNDGNNWNVLETNTIYHLWDVFFIDQQNGWCAVGDGNVLKTSDGGLTFQSFPTNEEGHIYSVFFLDEYKGWAVGRSHIQYTNDGGNSWNIQYTGSGQYNMLSFKDIYFIDSLQGWACGKYNEILHTKDGGQNWVQHSGFDNQFSALHYNSDNEMIVVGRYGCVLYSDQADYLPPKILNQSEDTIICEDQDLTLFIDVIGDTLSIQWYDMMGPIQGETGNTFFMPSITPYDGGLYSCEVSNRAGAIISKSIMVSIKPKVQITSHPQNTFVYENDTVNLVIGVTGALPISYQWQKNGTDLPGAIYNAQQIYGVQLSDSGYYQCIVSNDCTVDTTDVAKLTVFPESGISELSSNPFIAIYPNPVKSICQVKFNKIVKNGIFKIYSISGDFKKTGEFPNSEEFKSDLSFLSPGIYILKIISSDLNQSVKFIKH